MGNIHKVIPSYMTFSEFYGALRQKFYWLGSVELLVAHDLKTVSLFFLVTFNTNFGATF